MIVNPKSRGGATGRRWPSIEAKLRDTLGAIDVEPTRGPRDAERIAREGVRAGVELVIAAGGDGTASEVVAGIVGAGLGAYAELALLPLGTGGDLARGLGLEGSLDERSRASRGASRDPSTPGVRSSGRVTGANSPRTSSTLRASASRTSP